jgi:hypothetical protein
MRRTAIHAPSPLTFRSGILLDIFVPAVLNQRADKYGRPSGLQQARLPEAGPKFSADLDLECVERRTENPNQFSSQSFSTYLRGQQDHFYIGRGNVN